MPMPPRTEEVKACTILPDDTVLIVMPISFNFYSATLELKTTVFVNDVINYLMGDVFGTWDM